MYKLNRSSFERRATVTSHNKIFICELCDELTLWRLHCDELLCDEFTQWRVHIVASAKVWRLHCDDFTVWRLHCVTTSPCDEFTVWRVHLEADWRRLDERVPGQATGRSDRRRSTYASQLAICLSLYCVCDVINMLWKNQTASNQVKQTFTCHRGAAFQFFFVALVA